MRTLIVALQHWMGIARLPGALHEAGFEVAVLAPRGSYITRTRHIAECSHLPLLPTLWSRATRCAIARWRPTIVIPGDDLAVQLLERLRLQAAGRASELTRLLNTSLGDVRALDKGYVQELARRLDLLVPSQAPVGSPEDALQFGADMGYPCVLKQPFGFGGLGVQICVDETALQRVLQRFFPPWPERVLRSCAGSWTALLPRGVEFPQPFGPACTRGLQIQRFVPGTPALYCMSALQGTHLAGFASRKERVHPSPQGPSSVVRTVEHPEMAQAAAKLALHLRCSGFASFDFLLQEGSGRAYLLECNPRPVPVAHLGRLIGTDLCAALFERLKGRAVGQGAPARDLTVALFPQEWRRDPTSLLLREAYHDVPWDDPVLLRALLHGER